MQLLLTQPHQKLRAPLPAAPAEHPKPYRHEVIRFAVLGMVSSVLLANEYTFNNPQALQDSIQQELDINQSQFNMLYTIVAIPNIVFAICVGLLIDYFGVRVSFLLLTAGMPLFQLIVAFGATYANYHAMLLGRFLFGLIFQSIDIAVSCYVVTWFIGKELGLALGLATTLPQFGNALNSYLTPIIYEKTHKLGAPLFVSVGICFVAFAFACIVTYLDVIADETDKRNNIRVVRDMEHGQGGPDEQFKFEDLKSLNSSFWLLSFLCMLAIAQYVPFLDNSNKLLQVRFCFSQVTAGQNITVTYIVVGMFGFPLGWLIDRLGFRRYFAVSGMTIFTLGHLIILLFPQCLDSAMVREWSGVSYGLFLLGIGYCFYANCLFPSIALVVRKKVTGTAFGIMQMLQNLAMAVYPTISALIVQTAATEQVGYRLFSLFFVVTGLFGIVLSTMLFFINDRDKKKLDASSKQSNLVKIEYHASLTDTEQAGKKSRKSPTKVSGFHTDNDVYDSHESSDNEVQVQTKKFQIQLEKRRLSQKKLPRPALSTKVKSSRKKGEPKNGLNNRGELFSENEASEEDNIQDQTQMQRRQALLDRSQ